MSDERWKPIILTAWQTHRKVLGARKLWLRLRRDGHDIARCTVERLMRELGIAGVVRGKRKRPVDTDLRETRPADLVDRHFARFRTNQLWVADFTYVWTWSGWVYVAFVFDAHSRRIIGWRAATSMTTPLTRMDKSQSNLQQTRIFILAYRPGILPNTARVGRFQERRDAWSGESQSRNDSAVASDHRPCSPRTAWLAEQERRLRDTVVTDQDHLQRWGRYADAIVRWEHVTGRAAPTPALVDERAGPRATPEFVEWLMGLPQRWVTAESHNLTSNQQVTALGNGVLALQAHAALEAVALSQQTVLQR